MTEADSADQKLIRNLTDIVLANLGDEKFGVKELAQESGMSRYRLTKRLEAISNRQINQFIREVRLQKALEMLKDEELTVSEVAYKTGFSSPAYFNVCFHEFFGYPPGKVKKGIPVTGENRTPDQITSNNERKRTLRYYIFYFLAAIPVLAVLLFLTYYVFVKNKIGINVAPASEVEKSIAVLPFKNLSDNTSDQYFYDGVMEEIFNNLSKVKDLKVISRTSVEQYKKTAKTIPQIGKELDVNYLVEGSGQKYGNIFRLRVQLIEVSSDRHLWSDSYQHVIKKPLKFFRIQSRMAQEIASELSATITPRERQLIEKVPTTNMTAYELYLKANENLKNFENSNNPDLYRNACNFYKKALVADTAFARAFTGLANAFLSRFRWETYLREDYLDSVLILVNKALSIDNKLDDAYFLKGQYYRLNGHTEEALENYDKAIEINPNFYDSYVKKVYLLTWISGDYVKGIETCNKALELIRGSERPVIIKGLARCYLDAGLIENAKYYYHEAFVLDKDTASYTDNLAFLEFCAENFDEALKLWKVLEGINPESTAIQNYYYVIPGHNTEAYGIALKDIENLKKSGTLNIIRSHRTGYAYWQVGKKDSAKYFFKQQIKYSEVSIKLGRNIELTRAAYYDMAATYAFLGYKEKAYKYLDEFAKKNSIPLSFLIFIKHDLLFKSIRNEARFKNILQAVEAKYLAEHERVEKWLEEQ
jgi:TolB-like protein/AraC-like DNA-binding protein